MFQQNYWVQKPHLPVLSFALICYTSGCSGFSPTSLVWTRMLSRCLWIHPLRLFWKEVGQSCSKAKRCVSNKPTTAPHEYRSVSICRGGEHQCIPLFLWSWAFLRSRRNLQCHRWTKLCYVFRALWSKFHWNLWIFLYLKMVYTLMTNTVSYAMLIALPCRILLERN